MQRIHTRLAATALVAATSSLHAASYFFSDGAMGPDFILHPSGYTGEGGVLRITVAARQGDFSLPALGAIERALRTWEQQQPTTGNILTDIGSEQLDFETLVLHEIGHCLGLAHNNAASESGLPLEDRDFAKGLPGPNGVLDIDRGPDGIEGTSDDLRADDVSLNWSNIADDPFILPAIVDPTTYAVRSAFPNINSRQVAASPAFVSVPDNTQSVMNQGQLNGESLRSLSHDDVAGIQIARAGLDRIAGTADDYDIEFDWLSALPGTATSEDVDIWIEFAPVAGGAASVLATFFTREGGLGGSAQMNACGCCIDRDIDPADRGGMLAHGVVVDADVVLPINRPWFFGDASDCNDNGITDDIDLQPGGLEIDCNRNGIPDSCDIEAGRLVDANNNGIGDACETCLGDVQGDGDVDFFDLNILLDRWGTTTSDGDVDFNGVVNFRDLDLMLSNWGASCDR